MIYHRNVLLDLFAIMLSDGRRPDFWMLDLIEKVGDDPQMARDIAWEVVARERAGRPIPEPLKDWFIKYAATVGSVPKAPPDRKGRDKEEVRLLMNAFGMTRTEAIRIVAEASNRERNAVQTNLYR